jgi:hypothetical protein
MPLSAPVVAQDFQKGLAAYDTGDFATALQEWKPLAEDRGFGMTVGDCVLAYPAFVYQDEPRSKNR